MSGGKYLRFVDVGASLTGKTRKWNVLNMTSTDVLGRIEWKATWRRYVFCTTFAWTVYDVGCLREIADFIEQQMKARP